MAAQAAAGPPPTTRTSASSSSPVLLNRLMIVSLLSVLTNFVCVCVRSSEGGSHELAKRVDLLEVVSRAAALGPTELSAVHAEEILLQNLRFVQLHVLVGAGVHVESIRWAVGLADKAGLAVFLAGNDGRPSRYGVEHVGGASLGALVALDAPRLADDLDHWLDLPEFWRKQSCIEDCTHSQYIVYQVDRSEERRVGKECRSRWSPY